MAGLRSRVLGACKLLEVAAERSCLLAVILMTVLTLVQVVLRYIFRTPLVWTEEASVFLMIWMAFVGAGVAMRRGAHIAMLILVERLPRWLSRSLLTSSRLLMLAFLVVIAWQGWLLAMSVGGQRSPALAIAMTWPYLTMPLGSLFMATQLIASMMDPGSPGNGGDIEII
jgi:TRAP-type C4-dicarboxylate transport system permease small subunit